MEVVIAISSEDDLETQINDWGGRIELFSILGGGCVDDDMSPHPCVNFT